MLPKTDLGASKVYGAEDAAYDARLLVQERHDPDSVGRFVGGLHLIVLNFCHSDNGLYFKNA